MNPEVAGEMLKSLGCHVKVVSNGQEVLAALSEEIEKMNELKERS